MHDVGVYLRYMYI